MKVRFNDRVLDEFMSASSDKPTKRETVILASIMALTDMCRKIHEKVYSENENEV